MPRRPTTSPPPPPEAPNRRMPPLSMLRAFEAVGRLASMRRAAADLGVGHPVISRHMRGLEDWLGARLVETGPRGVVLTEEGRVFHAKISAAFAMIADATADLRPTTARRPFRLWCVPGLAGRWLAPRLADLQQALPGVEIVLRASTDRPDFERWEADCEIWYGEAADTSARAVLLDRSRLFPVASPGWVASHPPIAGAADLESVTLIHEESRDQWRRWFMRTGHRPHGELAGPRLWYSSSALDAAVAGQGVALATSLQAADDLAAGRLVELLDTQIVLGGYWLIAPAGRWNDPTVARFRAWAIAEAAKTAGGEA